MIKTIQFLSEKIVIIEVMLIILYLFGNYFNVNIPYLTDGITMVLTYITPISIIALIIYIILSILNHKWIKLLVAALVIYLAYLYFTKKV